MLASGRDHFLSVSGGDAAAGISANVGDECMGWGRDQTLGVGVRREGGSETSGLGIHLSLRD